MTGRLWYPQLDIYDAVRRMAGLLILWDSATPPSQERLYIADFYLANPPLLHKTQMTSDVRRQFHSLEIPRPEKEFISYPSAPILFQKMAEVQKQAFQTLTGKGLIDLSSLGRGVVQPSLAGIHLFEQKFAPLLSSTELRVGAFIVNSFTRGSEEIHALRQSTGLRRLGT